MSEYGTPAIRHKKTRGKKRVCEWCGQFIEIGELYDKWLWYDAGIRSTVYAHAECSDEWKKDEFAEPNRDYERPNNQIT